MFLCKNSRTKCLTLKQNKAHKPETYLPIDKKSVYFEGIA